MTDLTAILIIKRHSARVPGKNFRALGGRPLFRWILDTLLGTDGVERVVINTDAVDRLEACGLPQDPRLVLDPRKQALSGDHITANTLLADVMPRFPSRVYLMTHATSPFLSAETIARALAELEASPGADSLFSVSRHRARFYGADGRALNHNPDNLVPTQDLEAWYEENSALYLFTAESFAATGSRVGQHPITFPTPPWESVDIDVPDDWHLAELIAAGLNAAGDG